MLDARVPRDSLEMNKRRNKQTDERTYKRRLEFLELLLESKLAGNLLAQLEFFGAN